MRSFVLVAVLSCALAACGGGGGGSAATPEPAPPVPAPEGVRQTGYSAVQGVSADADFRFGQGLVVGAQYYLANQTTASVDVFDTASGEQVGRIQGEGAHAFAGIAAGASEGGPNALTQVGDLIYAADVDSVKVIDPASRRVVQTVGLGASGGRAETGCHAAQHGLYMTSISDRWPLAVVFVDTRTRAVVARVNFPDEPVTHQVSTKEMTIRLGQCRYDPATGNFLIGRVVGADLSPFRRGELLVIPAQAVLAIAPGQTVAFRSIAGHRAWPTCLPTGLALGPGTEAMVGCAGNPAPGVGKGIHQWIQPVAQFLDRTTGALIAAGDGGGGGQLEYDAQSRRYYNAAHLWQEHDGDCRPNSSVCSPALFVLSADTHAIVQRVNTGKRASSVAVDPVTGKAFVPVAGGRSPTTCSYCADEPAGVRTYAIR